jgi:hypothetical protein
MSCNAALDAKVCSENGQLILSIGIDTLMWAASQWAKEENAQRTEGESYEPLFVITDETGWAEDVRKALTHEDEAGESMLTRLLDKAFEKVLQRGSCNVAFPEDQSKER